MSVDIQHGDCFDLIKQIPPGSVDMVLCDLPYGVTHNKWDCPLPFSLLWGEYNRVVKPNGAVLLFASGMFQANLLHSNPNAWKYNLVWDKQMASGFLNANRMPLRSHEEICVFYRRQPVYNPQKWIGKAPSHGKGANNGKRTSPNYGNYDNIDNSKKLGRMKYPRSILSFPRPAPSKSVHPTEKPVALLEYLIRTYTNEGETVLDNCMGSGSTGVACVNTGRNFIGYEIDEQYYRIAEQRISEAQKQIAKEDTDHD